MSRIMQRFRTDRQFRFDVVAVGTFCVSSTWWIALLLTCPLPHAWRWIANSLTYGVWQTFVFPIAVGIVAATIDFRPDAQAQERSASRWRYLLLGVPALLLIVPVMVDFNTTRKDSYMLKDPRFLNLELELRRAYWQEEKHPELAEYEATVTSAGLSELRWNAVLNPLLTWVFLSLIALYVAYLCKTLTAMRRDSRLAELALATGLISFWLPCRHYADWHTSYFLGPRRFEVNDAWFFLFLLAALVWLVLGVSAWRQRARRLATSTTTQSAVTSANIANAVLAVLFLLLLARQYFPDAPSLTHFYHSVEIRLSDLQRAPIVVVAVMGLALFTYWTAREQFKPEEIENIPGDNSLSGAVRKAWLAYEWVKSKEERELTDREAWAILREQELPQNQGELGELANYEPPPYETFARYLREARKALGEQKNSPRRGRPHGGSIVPEDGI